MAIDAGRNHTCAVLGAGSVRCWGENGEGQLGNGTRDKANRRPRTVVGLEGVHVVGVSASSGNSCAVTRAGRGYCWGGNRSGQLGTGAAGEPSARAQLVSSLREVKKISAGESHICALLRSGQVMCWGDNDRGRLGTRSVIDLPDSAAYEARETPPVTQPDPVDGLTGVVDLAAGHEYTCVALSSGKVNCWGGLDIAPNNASSLNKQLRRPRAIVGLTGVVRVESVWDLSMCAGTDDGRFRCWSDFMTAEVPIDVLGDLVRRAKWVEKPKPCWIEVVDAWLDRSAGKVRFCLAVWETDEKVRPVECHDYHLTSGSITALKGILAPPKTKTAGPTWNKRGKRYVVCPERPCRRKIVLKHEPFELHLNRSKTLLAVLTYIEPGESVPDAEPSDGYTFIAEIFDLKTLRRVARYDPRGKEDDDCHHFMPGTGKPTPREYRQPNHVPRQVIEEIAAWVKRH